MFYFVKIKNKKWILWVTFDWDGDKELRFSVWLFGMDNMRWRDRF